MSLNQCSPSQSDPTASPVVIITPIASYQSHIPIQLPLTSILCVWLNWDENGCKLRHWPTMTYNDCMAKRFIGCPWASFCSRLNMLVICWHCEPLPRTNWEYSKLATLANSSTLSTLAHVGTYYLTWIINVRASQVNVDVLCCNSPEYMFVAWC